MTIEKFAESVNVYYDAVSISMRENVLFVKLQDESIISLHGLVVKKIETIKNNDVATHLGIRLHDTDTGNAVGIGLQRRALIDDDSIDVQNAGVIYTAMTIENPKPVDETVLEYFKIDI